MSPFSLWQKVVILSIGFLGIVFSLPNIIGAEGMRFLPSWLPQKSMNLGLDLQGGAHLLLQVGVDEVITERLESVRDSVRQALRGSDVKIGYTNLVRGKDDVSLMLTDAGRLDEARRLIAELSDFSELSFESDSSGRIRLSFTPIAKRDLVRATIDQSIEIVRSRIDALGTSEPTIQSEGARRILVQLPGGDPERVKALLGKTAKMNFRMLDETAPAIAVRQGRVQSGSEVLPAYNPQSAEPYYLVRRKVSVSGDRLENATAGYDSRQGGYGVTVTFDSVGTRQFARVTKNNVNKRFAIVLDGQVVSAPVINEPIPGGSAIISGSFSATEANDLALLLRAGALPAPLTVLEERSVGPSLGADSIAAGQFASIIGLILVSVFLLFAYGFFGIFANIALAINLFLIVGALSFLQATLTLPGIAGIVLTIGMAVDANVLIFERIREELKNERTPINAVTRGYERALRTIIDANVTTLFATVLLYLFGSGPIRGFAVTLSIGLLTSMFTAVLMTRLLMTTWLLKSKTRVLPL